MLHNPKAASIAIVDFLDLILSNNVHLYGDRCLQTCNPTARKELRRSATIANYAVFVVTLKHPCIEQQMAKLATG